MTNLSPVVEVEAMDAVKNGFPIKVSYKKNWFERENERIIIKCINKFTIRKKTILYERLDN
jgi:hypothetical protein